MNIELLVKDLINKGIYLSSDLGKLKVKTKSGALTDEIKIELKQYRAEIVKYLESGENDNTTTLNTIEIPRRKEGQKCVVSYAQKRLWFVDKLEGNSLQYNMPGSFRLKGDFDQTSFRHAIEGLIKRHEILRTTFLEENGEPRPILQDDISSPLVEIDISELTHEQQEIKLSELAKKDLQQPFDLSKDLMIRFVLIVLSSDEYVVLMNIHHIAFDGWSMKILLHDFMELYTSHKESRNCRLTPLKIQYSDFAFWQAQTIDGNKFEDEIQYWRNRLDGIPKLHSLPLDKPRPEIQRFHGGSYIQEIDIPLTESITTQLKTLDVTLFMYMYTAFTILLARISDETDIVIGTPISGREHTDVENLIGFFINTLVLRSDLSGKPSLKDLLLANKQHLLDAYDNQHVPFDKLVEVLKPERNLSHDPLFQIVFRVSNEEKGGVFTLPGLTMEAYEESLDQSKTDLEISVREEGGKLFVNWMYNSDLFLLSSIKIMAENFTALLAGLVQYPNINVHSIELLDQASNKWILQSGCGPKLEEAQPFIELFESTVKQYPQNIAAYCNGEEVTYEILNRKANKLAAYLIDIGIEAETCIGIYLDNSIELLLALLGVMKTGATYVALDLNHPQDRINGVIKAADVELVILNSALSGNISLTHTDILLMDEAISDDLWLEEFGDFNEDKQKRNLKFDNTAYILFTSGSTGMPKGVMVTQKGLSNYLDHARRHYYNNNIESSLVSSPLGFDATITTLLSPLVCGKKVILLPQNDSLLGSMKDYLFSEANPMLFKLTPAHLEALSNLADEGTNSNVAHTLVIGGEQLTVKTVMHWKNKLLPNARFVNEYGPTETVVGCSIFTVASSTNLDAISSSINCPIGLPIQNTQLFVLSDGLQLQPINAIGELYIGGTGVAKGYIGQPELSDDRFIFSPFNLAKGNPGSTNRLYKTGDLVRWLGDENGEVTGLEFIGRKDHQVKIRGYRIELGEIEAAILDHIDVKECVVLSKSISNQNDSANTSLLAFIVLNEITCSNDDLEDYKKNVINRLKTKLLERLPSYMVPSGFIFIDKIPLTVNAKVDRTHLLGLSGDVLSASTYCGPRNDVEKILCQNWKAVLQLEKVGIFDNFFDLGGHSLLATKLISLIRSTMDVELPLRGLFAAPTVSALAEYIKELRNNTALPPIQVVQQRDNLPLSFSQKRLWFIDQLGEGSAQYNMPRAFRIKGKLDTKALNSAVKTIIQRHEVLRTRFLNSKDDVRLQVSDEFQLPVNFLDLTSLNADEQERKVNELVHQDTHKTFDLSQDILIRLNLITLSPNNYVLLFNMHHIASDGWSFEVLGREFSKLYKAYSENLENPLTPLKVQYADYANWQHEWLQGQVLKGQIDYWLKQLCNLPKLHGLPLDKPRPKVQRFEGKLNTQIINPSLTASIHEQVKKMDATLFIYMYSALAALLARLSNENDIVIGTPISGRTHSDTEGLIGFFVNSLVLRADLSGQPTFASLVERNKQNLLDAYENQHVPFERLVEELKPERSMSHNPLFQIMLQVNNESKEEAFNLPGLSLHPYEKNIEQSKMDLAISIHEEEDKLVISWLYNSEIFIPASIDIMSRVYVNFLEKVVAAPKESIYSLPLLNKKQEEKILKSSTGEVTNPEELIPFIELFECNADKYPHKIAARCNGEEVTYAMLNARSERLAAYLIKSGVRIGTCVGMYLDNSLELLVSLLGVMKAGATYVPLDPQYPIQRINTIIEVAKIGIVILADKQLEPNISPDLNKIILDSPISNDAWLQDYEGLYNKNHKRNVKSDDVVYILFTSGSTGTPKGVMVTQKGLSNYLVYSCKHFFNAEIDSALVSSPLAFDSTITTLLPPLACGKMIILLAQDDNLLTSFKDYMFLSDEAMLFKMTPSHLDVLSNLAGKQYTSERPHILVIGGEPLMVRTLEHWKDKLLPNAVLVNEYGPTETVVGCSIYPVESKSNLNFINTSGSCSIGYPIQNTQLYVLGRGMQLQPAGSIGELYIGGAGVAKGYVAQPKLSNERFIPSPFTKADESNSSQKLYKTGDLARWVIDYNGEVIGLEFVGRIDHQVKVRGYRIELGEIEAAIQMLDYIQDVAVLAKSEGDKNDQLVAYIVPHQDQIEKREDSEDFLKEIRAHLKDMLPEYMLPTFFIVLDKMPLTVNGKIDTNALPLPLESDYSKTSHVKPRNDLEEVLCQCWEETLERERIGIFDDFFELGGHSLLAARLINQIRERLDIELPLRTLFEEPTISGLSEYIETRHCISTYPEINILEDRTKLPLSFAQQRLWFIDKLDSGNAQYNMQSAFRLIGKLNVKALVSAFEGIVARHEVLRTRYIENDNEVFMHAQNEVKFPIIQIDLSDIDTNVQESKVKALVEEDISKAFDLEKGDLLRLCLLKLSSQEYIVIFNMHHIVSDGLSLRILIQEFNELYSAHCQSRESTLPKLNLQYADYASWQREWLTGDVLDEQLNYWLEQLRGIPQLHSLPIDRVRPKKHNFDGGIYFESISNTFIQQLIDLCQSQAVTLYILLETAFATLLGRYSHEDDIVIGSPIAGRNHQDLEPLIGLFLNSIVLRNSLSGNPTFSELLKQNKKMILDAYSHQDIPFEMLVEEINPKRTRSHHPLFQIVFSLQAEDSQELNLPGLETSSLDREEGMIKYDLELSVYQWIDSESGHSNLSMKWNYSKSIFNRETISRLSNSFISLLESIVANPNENIKQLKLLSGPSIDQLMNFSKGKDVETTDNSLLDMFERQVLISSDSLAIVNNEFQLSYQKLNHKANRLAHCLKDQGVGSGDYVGILLERSCELIISLLAVMKSGAAYIPLDSKNGSDRLIHIIKDSGIEIVLTRSSSIKELPISGLDVLLLDDALSKENDWLLEYSNENLGESISLDDSVYIIYTSGSTGKPKGVEISHRGLLDYICYASTNYYNDNVDAALVAISHSFDISVPAIYLPLVSGGVVDLLPSDNVLQVLADRLSMSTSNVYLLRLTPSHINALLEILPDTAIFSNHIFVIGGEVFSLEVATKLQEKFPCAQIYNHYGPTETVVGCCLYDFSRDGKSLTKEVPIGQPMDNTTLYVLDSQLNLSAIGMTGELFIGGSGIAKGYLNQPTLTTEKFIKSPFIEGERLYKTGDLVCWLPDGNLSYIGRNDTQVKLRGFRIELNEIEKVLESCPFIYTSKTIVYNQGNSQQLISYAVIDKKSAPHSFRITQNIRNNNLAEEQVFSLPNGMEVFGLNKLETEYLYHKLFHKKFYFKHGVEISDGDCIFDVGANIGLFSLSLIQNHADLNIYAFEPIPQLYEILKVNSEIYAPENIFNLCLGLSDFSQTSKFNYFDNASVLSGLNEVSKKELSDIKEFIQGIEGLSDENTQTLLDENIHSEKVQVKLSTISKQIKQHNIEKIDLLKISAESSELSILKGIDESDWEKIRQIVLAFEFNEKTLTEINETLELHGFSVNVEGLKSINKPGTIYIYAVRDVTTNKINPIGKVHTINRQTIIENAERSLEKQLPEYMLPSKIILMDQLPLTANGKIDVNNLPAPDYQNQREYVAPQSETEERLVKIWQQILQLERIGVTDNFFVLGGHSLMVVRLSNAISKAFKVNVGLVVIFDNPTIREIAYFIDDVTNTIDQQNKLYESAETLEEFEL